jgi:hypothetical protein
MTTVDWKVHRYKDDICETSLKWGGGLGDTWARLSLPCTYDRDRCWPLQYLSCPQESPGGLGETWARLSLPWLTEDDAGLSFNRFPALRRVPEVWVRLGQDCPYPASLRMMLASLLIDSLPSGESRRSGWDLGKTALTLPHWGWCWPLF